MTHTTKNALSQEKLKERLNFSKMFDRQAGQIQQTKHIKNLLNPIEEKPQEVLTSKNEFHEQNQLLVKRLNRLEEILILKMEKLEQKNLKSILIDFTQLRTHKYLAGAIIFASLIISISHLSSQEVITKEKIVYKPQTINPTGKVKDLFILTKFVNLRESPSKSGIKIDTLAPNSSVKILEELRGWKKIQFKNYVQDKTIIGWIYGENLKRVTP